MILISNIGSIRARKNSLKQTAFYQVIETFTDLLKLIAINSKITEAAFVMLMKSIIMLKYEKKKKIDQQHKKLTWLITIEKEKV